MDRLMAVYAKYRSTVIDLILEVYRPFDSVVNSNTLYLVIIESTYWKRKFAPYKKKRVLLQLMSKTMLSIGAEKVGRTAYRLPVKVGEIGAIL